MQECSSFGLSIIETSPDTDIRSVTSEQLMILNKSLPFSIGSHGATHANLIMPSSDDAKQGILQSKSYFGSILQELLEFLGFPCGSFSQTHSELAREAGYRRVFSTSPAPASLRPEDYVIARIRVISGDWRLEIRRKILAAYRELSFAFALKRTLRSWLQMVQRFLNLPASFLNLAKNNPLGACQFDDNRFACASSKYSRRRD
jgi:hypothetical protein